MAIQLLQGVPLLASDFMTSMEREWYEFGFETGLKGENVELSAYVAPEYEAAFYDGLQDGLALYLGEVGDE